ncbi:MAG: PLP-dependent transferase [Candidatus Hodgkinia cicadicola]
MVSMDNSWTTPLEFKPLTCGVDVSVNALTKYPCGESDVVMGSVSADARVAVTLMKYHSWFGMCVGVQESYVVLKGLKTAKARLFSLRRCCWGCEFSWNCGQCWRGVLSCRS